MVKDYIRPEKRGEFKGLLVNAQNFFKHADRDANEVLDFDASSTDFLLWDACKLYERLASHKLPLLVMFNVWFFRSYPEVLREDVQKHLQSMPTSYDPKDRRGFFVGMLPVAEEWCAEATPQASS